MLRETSSLLRAGCCSQKSFKYKDRTESELNSSQYPKKNFESLSENLEIYKNVNNFNCHWAHSVGDSSKFLELACMRF